MAGSIGSEFRKGLLEMTAGGCLMLIGGTLDSGPLGKFFQVAGVGLLLVVIAALVYFCLFDRSIWKA